MGSYIFLSMHENILIDMEDSYPCIIGQMLVRNRLGPIVPVRGFRNILEFRPFYF
jgi:hypothetical protein